MYVNLSYFSHALEKTFFITLAFFFFISAHYFFNILNDKPNNRFFGIRGTWALLDWIVGCLLKLVISHGLALLNRIIILSFRRAYAITSAIFCFFFSNYFFSHCPFFYGITTKG